MTTATRAAEPAAAPASAGSTAQESWQVLTIRGQRIGYAHGTTYEESRQGETIIISDVVTQMSITRLGQTLRMHQVMHLEETQEGELLKVVSQLDNPPNSTTTTRGTVTANKLTLTTSSGGSTSTKVIEPDGPILSPGYPERFLQSDGLDVGEVATFEVFESQLGQMATVTLKRLDDETTQLWGGNERKLKHITMTQSLLPGVATSLYVDDEGEVQKTVMPLLGMASYTVEKDVALKEIEGEPLDLALETFINVALPQDPHSASKAVYRLTVEGADPAKLIAGGGTQSVAASGDEQLELTVRSIEPGAAAPADPDAAASPGEEFLESSRFVEWKDPLLQQLAAEGGGDAQTPAEVAIALEKFVHQKIASKNFSTAMATAAEVAHSRSGDCTEHAVLLAALLRARGIPSRVAIGFVYAEGVKGFGGHMWTEAWLNGRWVPLDGTLGRGGIGVGHIKVSDSSLGDEGTFPLTGFVPLIHLVGRLKIELVSIE